MGIATDRVISDLEGEIDHHLDTIQERDEEIKRLEDKLEVANDLFDTINDRAIDGLKETA